MTGSLHSSTFGQQIEALEWDYDLCSPSDCALATISEWVLTSLRAASLSTERCGTMWWTPPRHNDSTQVLHWQTIADVRTAVWEEWIFSVMTSPNRVLVIQATLPSCIRQRCVSMQNVPTTSDAVSYVAWGVPQPLAGQALGVITQCGSGFMVGHDGEFVLAITTSGDVGTAPP